MGKCAEFTFCATKKRGDTDVRSAILCSILDCAFAYVDTIAAGERIIAQVDNRIVLDGVGHSFHPMTVQMNNPVHIAFALNKRRDATQHPRSDVSPSKDRSNASAHKREQGSAKQLGAGVSESVRQPHRSFSPPYLPVSGNVAHPCDFAATAPVSPTFGCPNVGDSVSPAPRSPLPSSSFPLLPVPLMPSYPLCVLAPSSSAPMQTVCPIVYSPSHGCFVSYPHASETVAPPYQCPSVPIAVDGVRRVSDVSGYHEEGPRGANLFVYYLPTTFDDKRLSELFRPFGTIVSTKVSDSTSSNL